MKIIVYQDSTAGSPHEDFVQWLEDHDEAFYLNRRSEGYMLHRARCGHLDREYGSTTTNRKVCADSEADLKAWAEAEGLELVRCLDCLG